MNLTSLNRRLKFSWSHIIAFVALIAVSYFTFMGAAYYTGGNFIVAATALAIVDFVLILVFIGAQQLKGSGVKMRRKIIWERILVISSPFIFFAAMTFGMYFWNIHGSQHGIIGEFNSALSNAGGMFNDYENYADRRLEQYESRLDSIQLMHSDDPYVYGKLGFTAGEEEYQRENMLLTLRTQLFGKRYVALRDAAHEWIRDARSGASVWNVFIVGNIAEIRSAIKIWDEQLHEIAAEDMSNECYPPKFSSESADIALHKISGVGHELSTAPLTPSAAGIIISLVLYLMLALPYMIQQRDGKSIYSLWGTSRRPDEWLDNSKKSEDNDFTTF